MATEFTLPDLGENITSGDVVSVLVKAGDVVSPGQAVLEVETEKAVENTVERIRNELRTDFRKAQIRFKNIVHSSINIGEIRLWWRREFKLNIVMIVFIPMSADIHKNTMI